MNAIIIPVLVLGVIALIASVLLYVLSKKFAVEEDPRLPAVLECLPGANCGGCGYPGCGGLANAIVKAGAVGDMMCPVGGDEVMAKIAAILAGGAEEAPKPQTPAKAEKKAGSTPKAPAKPMATEPKEFVPTALPTVAPKDKAVRMPAGCRPADMSSLKSI